MRTGNESYAWIDLDSVKLTKMDQNSRIQVRKEDRQLEIEVEYGSLSFNITEPLAEDETLDIRTSTMAVGIRGTCGWEEVAEDREFMRLYLLEGEVECTAGGERSIVVAGETAVMTDGRRYRSCMAEW